MKKIFFYTLLLCMGLGSLFTACSSTEKVEVTSTIIKDTLEEHPTLFGFDLTQYDVVYDTVQVGWTWNDLLATFPIDQYRINQTAKKASDSLIDLQYIKAGQPIAIFIPKNKEKKQSTQLVYELSPLTYITFNFSKDSVNIVRKDKPIEIKQRIISGEIVQNSSLYATLRNSMQSFAMTTALAQHIEGIYAWSVDFFHLQVGDKFVIVFDEQQVDGESYAIDKIKYAWFEHADEALYAFHYKDTVNNVSGFYDEKAKAMKRPFLKSPLKHFYITSHYSKARFHPILKRMRSHLGTDFAAPSGTPIHTTADGVVEIASYTGGNGNYVKIRHNSVYETQYLHMSRFAKGIHSGVHVEQGEVIGYVGMTGLATGPHVCYRFWKNGRQVDPFKQKFPESKPMVKEAIPGYMKFIAPLKNNLDNAIDQLKSTSQEGLLS